MSLSKKKSNIISKMKLYSSIANSNINTNSFDDLIPNTNDPIDFLIDIIKVTAGESTLETVTQNVLSKVISQKKLDLLSELIYESIAKNISESSSLPNSIKQDGITMPIKSFDATDSFRKTNITGSTASKNTNKFFEQMTKNVLPNPNTEVTLPSTAQSIKVKYNESSKRGSI